MSGVTELQMFEHAVTRYEKILSLIQDVGTALQAGSDKHDIAKCEFCSYFGHEPGMCEACEDANCSGCTDDCCKNCPVYELLGGCNETGSDWQKTYSAVHNAEAEIKSILTKLQGRLDELRQSQLEQQPQLEKPRKRFNIL